LNLKLISANIYVTTAVVNIPSNVAVTVELLRLTESTVPNARKSNTCLQLFISIIIEKGG